MQEREVHTEYHGSTTISRKNNEFGTEVALTNQLGNLLLGGMEKLLDHDGKFKTNLMILAEDSHSKVLAEKWQFTVTQNQLNRIEEKYQNRYQWADLS